MCVGLVALTKLVVAPSPKLQNRLLIGPVELSVNVTVNGAAPLVGLPLKMAIGAALRMLLIHEMRAETRVLKNENGAITGPESLVEAASVQQPVAQSSRY